MEHNDIAARDFKKSTLRALTKKGIRLIGLCVIPGDGEMPWANGERGYNLDDNGTGRIKTLLEVLDLAQKG